jgi:hypothetical protein
MSTVRKAIAAVAVVGTLAIAPLTIIAGQSSEAGVRGTVTTMGGQGGWPLKG